MTIRAMVVSLSLAAAGCITVPQQTVTLAETIQEQTASLQGAHEALITNYYDMLRHQVDVFLVEQWIPTFLAKAVANQQVQQQMGQALANASVSGPAIAQKVNAATTLTAAEKSAIVDVLNNASVGGQAELGEVMIRFGEAAAKQIEDKRRSLIAPIDEQERLMLSKIRASYAQLQSEEASIKAFLASAVQLETEENAVLSKLHLLNARDAVMHFAAAASTDAARFLNKADDAESFLSKITATNEQLKAAPSATPAAPAAPSTTPATPPPAATTTNPGGQP